MSLKKSERAVDWTEWQVRAERETRLPAWQRADSRSRGIFFQGSERRREIGLWGVWSSDEVWVDRCVNELRDWGTVVSRPHSLPPPTHLQIKETFLKNSEWKVTPKH